MRLSFNKFFISLLLLLQPFPVNIVQKDKVNSSIVPTFLKDTVILGAPQPNANNKDNNLFMPWVSALIVGFITICTNIYISNNARRTSLEVNRRDFNKTVLSGNRQLWISEFRELMSEIISKLSYFITKQSIDEIEFKAFSFLLIKAELMLSNEENKSFIEVILRLNASCSEIMKSNPPEDELDELMAEIKKLTIKIIENQWEMIKRGE